MTRGMKKIHIDKKYEIKKYWFTTLIQKLLIEGKSINEISKYN